MFATTPAARRHAAAARRYRARHKAAARRYHARHKAAARRYRARHGRPLAPVLALAVAVAMPAGAVLAAWVGLAPVLAAVLP